MTTTVPAPTPVAPAPAAAPPPAPAKVKLPRDQDPRNPNFRLAALLDEGSVELITPDDDSGMLAAVGTINGSRVVAFCSDATVMGGAMGVAGCDVVVQAYERAMRDRVPILGIWHSGGARLAEGVLSQCGTIIAMRLNNDRDQAFVKAAMPEGARGFLDAIPALRNRECIICGEGVAIPIRVRFDTLEESKRPASDDPSFVELWNSSGGEEDAVKRVVQRWRSQG